MGATEHILTGEENEILRKVSDKIKFEDSGEIISRLREAVSHKEALGVAAPQIGENLRVCLVYMNEEFVALINPEILSFSAEKIVGEEGCLSLPEIWGDVERPKNIRLKYTNEEGEEREEAFSGLPSRIIQHEVDHLNGVLFTDRMRKEGQVF